MISLVFDYETTGLPGHPEALEQPRAIEFGGVLVNEHAEVLEELSLLINPGIPLEPIITKITGLTDADLKDAPRFAEAARQMRPLFAAADRLIAHHAPFDMTITELEVRRCRVRDWPVPRHVICTVQEHAEAWGRRPKLLELYEYYAGEPLEQTHRALDDAHALVFVCDAAGILSHD